MDAELRQETLRQLRSAGASFAFLHESQVSGHAQPTSDLDVAAWWPSSPPQAFDVLDPM